MRVVSPIVQTAETAHWPIFLTLEFRPLANPGVAVAAVPSGKYVEKPASPPSGAEDRGFESRLPSAFTRTACPGH